jgi:hypothetical protein
MWLFEGQQRRRLFAEGTLPIVQESYRSPAVYGRSEGLSTLFVEECPSGVTTQAENDAGEEKALSESYVQYDAPIYVFSTKSNMHYAAK